MVVERIDIEGVFKDEISNRIEAAIQSIAEFGGEVKHGVAALDQINAVSKSTGKSLTLVANAARMLADEGEDAAAASKHLGTAMELASKKMLKTEDAGRILGRTLRGDVAALKELSPAASRAADKIAKIADPALRAKLGMQLLNREIKGSPRILDRMNSRMAVADAKLESMGLGFVSVKTLAMGAAAAIAAVGAAAWKVATVSLEAYIKQSSNAKQQMADLTTATDKLKVALGGLIFEMGGGSEALDEWTKRADRATKLTHELEAWMTKMGLGYKSTAPEVKETSQSMEDANAIIDQTQKELMGMVATLNPFTRALFKGADAIDFTAVSIDLLAEEAGISTSATQGQATALQNSLVPALWNVTGVVGSLTAKYRSLADAARSAWDAQVASGQIHIDPMTGAPTQFEGPTPHSGKFFPSGKKPKGGGGGGGGGGGRKGSQVPAWMQIEIDKADLMYETWKEETTQAEKSLLDAASGMMASSLGVTMPIIIAQAEALKAEIDGLNAVAAASNKIWTDLATGGISLAFESISGMTQALVEGGDALQAFGAGLLASLGDLLTQAGMAFVMLGTGVENIKLGVTAPGALIAIGVGMLALGGALKGFATRAQPGGGGGGDGGKTAQALQRFGRQLFDRQMGQESKNVMINIEGRQMRGYVLDVASDGLRTGSIPLTPVRRR